MKEKTIKITENTKKTTDKTKNASEKTNKIAGNMKKTNEKTKNITQKKNIYQRIHSN